MYSTESLGESFKATTYLDFDELLPEQLQLILITGQRVIRGGHRVSYIWLAQRALKASRGNPKGTGSLDRSTAAPAAMIRRDGPIVRPMHATDTHPVVKEEGRAIGFSSPSTGLVQHFEVVPRRRFVAGYGKTSHLAPAKTPGGMLPGPYPHQLNCARLTAAYSRAQVWTLVGASVTLSVKQYSRELHGHDTRPSSTRWKIGKVQL